MKKSLLLLPLILFLLLYPQKIYSEELSSPQIRVAVAVKKQWVSVSCNLGTFTISNSETGHILYQGKNYFLEGKRLNSNLFIATDSADNFIELDGKKYRGVLQVMQAGNNRLTIINILPVEDYLKGVVPCELFVPYPEAMKAQAIVARTFTLANLGKNKKFGFDLYATARDQVYGGIDSEKDISNKAIKDTFGQVLTYENKIAKSVMYHSSCGGATERAENVYLWQAIPYLTSVSCEHCKDNPAYQWQITWTKEELEEILAKTLDIKNFKLEDISIQENGPSGRVTALRIAAKENFYLVKGNGIRYVLKYYVKGKLTSLKSTLFTLKVEKDEKKIITKITVTGSGWGHGVGMCQQGIVALAKSGLTCEKILKYYFPNLEIEQTY